MTQSDYLIIKIVDNQRTAALHHRFCLHVSNFLTHVTDSSSITVKEGQKQRKEAKLIKQLEKQKQHEAAEKAKLEQSQNKKGNLIIISWTAVSPYPCE